MLIIYHKADLDGICSGAIFHRKFPEARLLGYDYREPFDAEEQIAKGEDVIMADVSMPMLTMEAIADRAGSFVWIDHHVSAYQDFVSHFKFQLSDCSGYQVMYADGYDWEYMYEPTLSACELCWEYVSSDEMPESVELLGSYDVWRRDGTEKWNDVILPFQYGMRQRGFTPEKLAEFIGHESTSIVERIIEHGRMVLNYQKQQDERLMLKSFDARLNIPAENGIIRCLVCNGAYNSTAFESKWDEEKYDAMVGITYDGKMWGISLRTTKDIDLSVIAKSFGGGGHAKAAGCGVDDLRKILIW